MLRFDSNVSICVVLIGSRPTSLQVSTTAVDSSANIFIYLCTLFFQISSGVTRMRISFP